MIISRISRVRGHRGIRDFSWPVELHSFGQFNLLYGWNGSGKTTLSNLFRSIQDKTAIAEGDVEFELQDGTKLVGSKLADSDLPPVRVFNSDFVARTVGSGGEAIEPIFYLGEDSVEMQQRVESLRVTLSEARTQEQTDRSAVQHAKKASEDFSTSQAKLIKEALAGPRSQGYLSYDKRRFKEAVEKCANASSAATPISADQKNQLKQQKEAQPKGRIAAAQVSTLGLDGLTARVQQLLGRTVVAEALAELSDDSQLASWVEQGLRLHPDSDDNAKCKFCGDKFSAQRREALEKHFNKAFEELQADLTTAHRNTLNLSAGLAETKFPTDSEFYPQLVDNVRAAVLRCRTEISKLTQGLSSLAQSLQGKRSSPFDAQDLPMLAGGDIETAASSLSIAAAEVNALVDSHNAVSDDFQTKIDEACASLEAAYAIEAYGEYLTLQTAMSTADAKLSESSAEPKAIEDKIGALEQEIVEHRRPADELNHELRSYLGRDELQFAIRESGYALSRAGRAVSDLSEGEKTAIAFLYFLKSLQDKNFDLARGIVVVDDPVSSLDTNALFSAFGYMKERTKSAGQLIVLTHNFGFFRQVKNWFHHLPKQGSSKVERRPGRFFMVKASVADDGLRNTQITHLDPLLERYESEYHYLFKCVYDEANRAGEVSLEHYYGIPNIARRLLEGFLNFRFPDCTGSLLKQLERIDFDEGKKTRILRFLHTYSHEGGIAGAEHDPTVLSETASMLIDLLEMIRHVDSVHFDGMKLLLESHEAD